MRNKLFLPFIIFLASVFFLTTKAEAAVNFNVEPFYDWQGRSMVAASEKLQSARAHFFVEDFFYAGLSESDRKNFDGSLAKLATEFDSVIYPKETSFFGSEWNPGIDNDGRVTILLARMADGVGGYFNSGDEYTRSRMGSSNEREMVYLNAGHLNSSMINAYLSQEFQHLISFNQKDKNTGFSEDAWLNEARSEYAITLNGYNNKYSGSYLEKRVGDYLSNPSDSLTEWSFNDYDYGSSNMFAHYLTDIYGADILKSQISNSRVGIASLNEALAGVKKNFSQVFSDWTVACYLNDKSIENGLYSFKTAGLNYLNLHVPPTATYVMMPNSSISTTVYVKDWSPHWYKFVVGGSLGPARNERLKFKFVGFGSKSNFKIPYIVTDFFGESKVMMAEVSGGGGTIYVGGFGKEVSSVVFVPTNQYKQNNFSASDNVTGLSFTVSTVPAESFADGDLIRAEGRSEVYIVKGKFKRWIQNPGIFNIYKHFLWSDIIEVSQEEIDRLETAWMIRAAKDTRVYEVNADGTKHWLNMTAEEFVKTGHDWGMVYEVDPRERDLYLTGADVLYKNN